MNTIVKWVASSTIAFVLVACASGPRIQSNHDRSVDFSQYETFGFAAEPGTDRGGYSTLVTEYFKAAVRNEMEALGYVYAESDPDLKVNFFTNVRDQNRTVSRPTSGARVGYYNYRYGMYSAYPMYGYDFGAEITSVNYRVGTANIDVVDTEHNRLIWEGVAEGRLGRDALENAEELIHEAVGEIFQRYPLVRDR